MRVGVDTPARIHQFVFMNNGHHSMRYANHDAIREKYGRDATLALAARGKFNCHPTAIVPQASSALADFVKATVDADGVVTWDSNGQVPPADILALWDSQDLPFDYEASVAARDAQVAESIKQYRANYQPPTGEQLAEMRAAFGPGGTVVDVISGHRIQL